MTDEPNKIEIIRRIKGYIIIEVPLLPEQISMVEKRLEELFHEVLNI